MQSGTILDSKCSSTDAIDVERALQRFHHRTNIFLAAVATGVRLVPVGGYVAVNNRRVNAGDYLWVISLKDGSPIKIPDDVEWAKRELGKITGDHSPSEVMPEVRRLCSDCTADGVQHGFLFAHGWNSPNELTVIEELQFREGWIAVKKRCRVVAGGIILVGHTAEKEDGLPELVRRAWTWSPFHSK
jgi:hypothetical protein